MFHHPSLPRSRPVPLARTESRSARRHTGLCWNSLDRPIAPKAWGRRAAEPLRIGLLVPFQGADAIWGPSCQYSAVLAAAELNERGGILGRQIELLAADAGGSPDAVVARAKDLVAQGAHALVGVHLSSVRIAIGREFAGRIPYVFAPLFEGGIKGSDVFAIGEVPERQFSGPLRWLMQQRGARRWFLAGNDYVWPRASHQWVRRFIEANGGEIIGEDYADIGQEGTGRLLDLIEKTQPDAVFQSLVGSECVPFNRMFSERGLAQRMIRFSGAIEENTLLAIGEEHTDDLYCAAGYFSALQTPENHRFLARYREAFGTTAPVQGVLSEACYEALMFLAALAGRAGSFRHADLVASFEGLDFASARGVTTVKNGIACGPTFLAKANGMEFEIVRGFRDV